MKNRINFSSHSGNMMNNPKLEILKSNSNSYNTTNSSRNNISNLNNANKKNQNKTTENNRLKAKSLEKLNNTNDKVSKNNYQSSSEFNKALGNDFIFNINDDFQTLVYKNTKLRELIVTANETIVYLVIKKKHMN